MNRPSGCGIWNDDRITVDHHASWVSKHTSILNKSFNTVVRRTEWIMDGNDDDTNNDKTTTNRRNGLHQLPLVHAAANPMWFLFFFVSFHFILPMNLTVMICRPCVLCAHQFIRIDRIRIERKGKESNFEVHAKAYEVPLNWILANNLWVRMYDETTSIRIRKMSFRNGK